MKEYQPIPKLERGHRSITFAEVSTGILLTTDGAYYLGKGEYFVVFDSHAAAVEFAIAYVKEHPSIECVIRDENGHGLERYCFNVD